MLTYEEAISSSKGLDTNEFIRSKIQSIYNTNEYTYYDISKFKNKLRFKNLAMAFTYELAVTKETNLIAVMSVSTFKFGYIPDLELILNKRTVSNSKKRELHLFRNGNWAMFVQVDILNGYSTSSSTTDYTQKDFLDVVYSAYYKGLSKTL